jgi:nitrate reductase assembly molybdenum cofactor insertion protein NarJ
MEAIVETAETGSGNGIESSDTLIANYELLADLFIYPEFESYKDKITGIHQYLLKNIPEAAVAMNLFMEFIESATLTDMQELYLRSFDVQAITTLDIGFILFGEDYKRGQLLVNLNREHREAGNLCHTELSDHLPNVLRLLSKMKDEVMRNEIATRLVMSAVVKMTEEFTPEKIRKKDEIYKKHQKTILDFSEKYRSVYFTLLQALLEAMKKDFDYETVAADLGRVTGCEETSACSYTSEQSGPEMPVSISSDKDFRQNIEIELIIEGEK